MISRDTAYALAELFSVLFLKLRPSTLSEQAKAGFPLDSGRLYDFLYRNEYPTWFCNVARDIAEEDGARALKDFLLKLHTGESSQPATEDWSAAQRIQVGQACLKSLAKDVLNYWQEDCLTYDQRRSKKQHEEFLQRLELDGYRYKHPHLLEPEIDEVQSEEETRFLMTLIANLDSNVAEDAGRILNALEKAYLAHNFTSAIVEAKRFMETVFRAAERSTNETGQQEQGEDNSFQADCEALAGRQLLDPKEKEAALSVYRMLDQGEGSNGLEAGDRARLLRRLALTYSQFMLLRVQGRHRRADGAREEGRADGAR